MQYTLVGRAVDENPRVVWPGLAWVVILGSIPRSELDAVIICKIDQAECSVLTAPTQVPRDQDASDVPQTMPIDVQQRSLRTWDIAVERAFGEHWIKF